MGVERQQGAALNLTIAPSSRHELELVASSGREGDPGPSFTMYPKSQLALGDTVERCGPSRISSRSWTSTTGP